MNLLPTANASHVNAEPRMTFWNWLLPHERTNKKAQMEFIYGQQAADAAHARQIELYNKQFYNELRTSDPAFQAARMAAAGFNPALMYSSSQGGLGVSMPNAAGGAPKTNVDDSSRGVTDLLGTVGQQVMNFALLKAQKENIEADTEVKKVTAKDVLPTEIDAKKMNIAEATERIENLKVQRQGHKLQNDFDQIRNDIAEATKEADIDKLLADSEYALRNVDYLMEQISHLNRENLINEETLQQKIEIINLELQNLTTDIALKNAQIQMNKANIKWTEADMNLLRERVSVQWDKNRIDEIIGRRMANAQLGGMISNTILGVGNLWKNIFRPSKGVNVNITSPHQ